MNPSPEVENRSQNAVRISSVVVVNIIWWMVMIAGIAVGATHLSRCPVQPNIPIYLIVMGAASLLSLSLTYTSSTCTDGAVHILSLVCTGFLHFFTFCWFIAGSVWVYSVYPPSYTPGEARYCHKTIFQFAFIVITVTWALMALIFFCGCCFGALTCSKTVMARGRLIPSRTSFYGGISDFQEPIGGKV
ncbi:transmembrane protein 272-like isoform X1 [Toxotes jaculatrix]|uniref:transmembrane protein 272-like isoform X1 n=1 Tax=Toxotes jaculatrix TaxID=941984 RepID=UPI001B3AFFF6|nr:transmembrane protein 272-like isoform X1 [Toxotes jaculatrix]